MAAQRIGPPATVIIGDHTQGLGILRSAAVAGGPVWVVNDKWLSLARCSRYLTGYRRVRRGCLRAVGRPDGAAELRRALLELPFSGRAALFAVNEDLNRFIHQNRAVLQARYAIPEVALERIYDKYTFNSLVPVAAQIETRLAGEVDWQTVSPPQRYLLKGRMGNAFRDLTGEKALPLADISPAQREQILTQLDPHQVVLQAIIATERLVRSVCLFSVAGRLRAWFGYDKVRQHPNRFGTGTYLRSVAVDDLRPVAEAIVAELNFTGVAEIEFIHDPETDRYLVIEMNPRAWKSVHFATQCGQNLVAAYLAYLAGLPAGGGGYRENCHWADLATDLPQMFRERRWPRYAAGFFECTWNRADLRPGLALSTLFPLMAWENFLTERAVKKWT